jgi:hypothetical protein
LLKTGLAATVMALPLVKAAVAVNVRAKLWAAVFAVAALGLTATLLTAPLTVPIV